MQKNKRGESSLLDNFFTSKEVAKQCIRDVRDFYKKKMKKWKLVVEPSAGAGSFFFQLHRKNRKAYDLEPQAEGIEKADFLEKYDIVVPGTDREDVLFIGNPPFGKNGAMALKFLERALSMANHVAFILPQSFRKINMQNYVKDASVHVVFEKQIPKNAFRYKEEVRDVPCVFQIWRRIGGAPRPKTQPKTTHVHFKFVSPSEEEIESKKIFSVQRVGAAAGRIVTDKEELKRKRGSRNFYFIEPAKKRVLKKMRKLDLENLPEKFLTAGMPSISKGELIEAYEGKKEKKKGNCLCVTCNKL